MMPLPNPIRTRSNSMRVGGNGWVGSVAALGCLAVVIVILVRLPGSSYEVKGFQTQSPIVFRDVAAAAGLTPKLICGTPKKEFILEVSGSGLVWFDFNNDGYLDLYLVSGSTIENLLKPGVTPDMPHNYLFCNNADGTFTDVTELAGVRGRGWGNGALAADFNNEDRKSTRLNSS